VSADGARIVSDHRCLILDGKWRFIFFLIKLKLMTTQPSPPHVANNKRRMSTIDKEKTEIVASSVSVPPPSGRGMVFAAIFDAEKPPRIVRGSGRASGALRHENWRTLLPLGARMRVDWSDIDVAHPRPAGGCLSIPRRRGSRAASAARGRTFADLTAMASTCPG
jgi:hypothetical protein